MKPGRSWFSVPRPYVIHDPMLGRTNVSDPVCSSSSAPPCREFDPCIDLMKHRSSTTVLRCGNSSDTVAPLCPYRLNAHGEASRLPVSPDTTRGLGNGSGLPSSSVSFGLWSNVSTWLGPP